MVKNKPYENKVRVKLVPRTSFIFDMLDVHKNDRQHQVHKGATSVCNEKNFIAKMHIISSHNIFLITLIARIVFTNQQLTDF